MIKDDTTSNISINRLYDAVLDIEDAVSELYVWQDGYYLDYVEPELYINISSEEAFTAYKKLADSGNALACCVVAICYSSNHVVKYNERLEYFYYKKAADLNFIPAYKGLGIIYERHDEYEKAFECYMKAWKGKYYPVYENLSDCYFYGSGCETSYDKGLEIIKVAADSGLKEAQFDLAYKYENEEGDLPKAKEYYEKAADQGYYSALLVLKEWFALVKGKEPDLVQYEKWEKCVRQREELSNLRRRNKIKALIPSLENYAKKENAEAQYNLALVYSRDSVNSVIPDLEKYIYWLKRSADNGYKKACYYLGMCYNSGDGVSKNKALAVHYLARVDSNAEVSWQLENIYGARLGITDYLNSFKSGFNKHKAFYVDESADYSEISKRDAFHFFLCKEERGDIFARKVVALCYYRGFGVKKNVEKASLYGYEDRDFNFIDIEKLHFDWLEKRNDKKNELDGRVSKNNEDALALYELGDWWAFNTVNCVEDWQKAFSCYDKSAQLDFPAAFYKLGNIYEYGLGLTSDSEKAYDAYEKGALLKDSKSAYKIAELAIENKAKLYLEAAKLGSKEAFKKLPYYDLKLDV